MLNFHFINPYLVVSKFNVVILTKNFRKFSQNGKLTLEHIIFNFCNYGIMCIYVVHLWHRNTLFISLFYSLGPISKRRMKACADPERFARGGQAHSNSTKSGPSSARQRRWWADSGPPLNADLAAS